MERRNESSQKRKCRKVELGKKYPQIVRCFVNSSSRIFESGYIINRKVENSRSN